MENITNNMTNKRKKNGKKNVIVTVNATKNDSYFMFISLMLFSISFFQSTKIGKITK